MDWWVEVMNGDEEVEFEFDCFLLGMRVSVHGGGFRGDDVMTLRRRYRFLCSSDRYPIISEGEWCNVIS